MHLLLKNDPSVAHRQSVQTSDRIEVPLLTGHAAAPTPATTSSAPAIYNEELPYYVEAEIAWGGLWLHPLGVQHGGRRVMSKRGVRLRGRQLLAQHDAADSDLPQEDRLGQQRQHHTCK